jgi:hypothetical protein
VCIRAVEDERLDHYSALLRGSSVDHGRGALLLILATVVAVNVLVIAVGWANARTQPKATARPYLIGTAGPLAYVLLIVFLIAPAVYFAVGIVASGRRGRTSGSQHDSQPQTVR